MMSFFTEQFVFARGFIGLIFYHEFNHTFSPIVSVSSQYIQTAQVSFRFHLHDISHWNFRFGSTKTVSHASPPRQDNHNAAILRSPITSILMIPFSQLLSWICFMTPCLHSSYTISFRWCNILRKGEVLKLLKFDPQIWLRLCVDVVFKVRK